MAALTTVDFVTRITTGMACGAVLGLEREWRARAAGLPVGALVAGIRTTMLIVSGAVLFVQFAYATGSTNPSQIASYVVYGIGFLGGGVILRDGFDVRGLNTAATVWCSAAVGILAGAGQLKFAVLATVAVLGIHFLGRPVGRLFNRGRPLTVPDDRQPYELRMVCDPAHAADVKALLVRQTRARHMELCGVDTAGSGGETVFTAQLLVEDAVPSLGRLVARLSLEPRVSHVDFKAAA